MTVADVVNLLDENPSKTFKIVDVIGELNFSYGAASGMLTQALQQGVIKKVGYGTYASLRYEGGPAGPAPKRRGRKRKLRKKVEKEMKPEYKLVAINRTYEISAAQLLGKLKLKGDLADIALRFTADKGTVDKLLLRVSELATAQTTGYWEDFDKVVEREAIEDEDEEVFE